MTAWSEAEHPRGRDGKFVGKQAIADAVDDEDARHQLLRRLDPENREKMFKLLARHAADRWEAEARKTHRESAEGDDEAWQDEARESYPSDDKDLAKVNRKLEEQGNPYRFVRAMPDPPPTLEEWDESNPEPEEPVEPEEWEAEPAETDPDYQVDAIHDRMWQQVKAAWDISSDSGMTVYSAAMLEVGKRKDETIADGLRRAAEHEAKARFEQDHASWAEQQELGGYGAHKKKWKADQAAWEKAHAAWEKQAAAAEKAADAWEKKHGDQWGEHEGPFVLEHSEQKKAKLARRLPPARSAVYPGSTMSTFPSQMPRWSADNIRLSAASPWQPFQSRSGKPAWRNTQTGERRYQEERPGDHEGEAAKLKKSFASLQNGPDDQAARIAAFQFRKTRQALAGVRSGRLTALEAADQLEHAATAADHASYRSMTQRYAILKRDAVGKFGADIVNSPEWAAVLKAFQHGARDSRSASKEMEQAAIDAVNRFGEGQPIDREVSDRIAHAEYHHQIAGKRVMTSVYRAFEEIWKRFPKARASG